jgi:hypothetical protein
MSFIVFSLLPVRGYVAVYGVRMRVEESRNGYHIESLYLLREVAQVVEPSMRP